MKREKLRIESDGTGGGTKLMLGDTLVDGVHSLRIDIPGRAARKLDSNRAMLRQAGEMTLGVGGQRDLLVIRRDQGEPIPFNEHGRSCRGLEGQFINTRIRGEIFDRQFGDMEWFGMHECGENVADENPERLSTERTVVVTSSEHSHQILLRNHDDVLPSVPGRPVGGHHFIPDVLPAGLPEIAVPDQRTAFLTVHFGAYFNGYFLRRYEGLSMPECW